MTAVTVNGTPVEAEASARRLSEFLRDELGLTATKVGCDAGDCGACTVLADGQPVNACMTPIGSVAGRQVVTLEGLDATGEVRALQRAFLAHGAAQCGICTPGMLVSAAALLRSTSSPNERQVMDALGGVLCRCTGYRKIVAAVMAAEAGEIAEPPPPVGKAVGHRARRVDGEPKVNGTDVFGADQAPDGALTIRIVRSPHHRASFRLGDLAAYVAATPGVIAVLTAADVGGRNRFGVIPATVDQPVFAEQEARFRGEAVAMVVGEPDALLTLDLSAFPVTWQELEPLMSIDDAEADGAPLVHADREGNVLVRGLVRRGDLDEAFATAAVEVEGVFETGFIEHAYIEPEAGYAERVGDRVDVQVTTQSPHMDRTELEAILGLPEGSVRIKPTAVGGGFGSKLDLSVQPYLALAAFTLDRPVRLTYTRPESMMSTTKRHPSRMSVRIGATGDGRLTVMDFTGEFDTGAYASWGPTVANRVPVHAGGPYVYDAYRARTAAVHTNGPPAGAFRGFGVPQSTIATEALLDELADALAVDRLELRYRNALTAGVPTVTGQVFASGVGYRECLEALRPHWERARADAAAANTSPSRSIRGVGLAGMWYGCGNTALPNPSTILVGLRRDGRVVLFQGAVDMGQGANTVMTQICADALGVDMAAIVTLGADTDTTPDAGKSSASRQTFVSGNATFLAASALRERLLALADASGDAHLELDGSRLVVHDRAETTSVDLASLDADDDGLVARATGTYDPPTTTLDADGQGEPYAQFGYGAHMAELEVDLDLGTVELRRITAAHDVGRAVNPTLIEGQIEGGVAQGIGMALMEEYIPGRNENLHDYLIPTIGDVPEVVSILIESGDPVGPYGAKGIGEHSLIPTAPAILNAIRDAVGAGVRKLPATPDRVLAAIARGRALAEEAAR
ncbi:MAG TPA: molybdopterin cofactor-binding domain-containing protein [Actinomycetota bacterium]|nr:molybdopterin cofactor-binding domain-containing protein [Actinomycetota bacterium]